MMCIKGHFTHMRAQFVVSCPQSSSVQQTTDHPKFDGF